MTGYPTYVAPTKQIVVKGMSGPLTVRGLTLTDITSLLQTHQNMIVLAVEKYRDSLQELYSTRSMDSFLSIVAGEFPELAGGVIAAATSAPSVEAVQALPAGVQIRALVAIAELTLSDMDSLKDPSPALAETIRRVMGAAAQRKSLLEPSTGLSVER